MKQIAGKASSFSLSRIADDFRQLDPNDVGTWALAPKLAVLLFLLVVCVGAGWWVDWRPELETLDQRQQDQLKLKDDWRDKKRQAVNLEEYKKQLAEIDRQFGALLKQLPNRSEMEALLVDINQAGKGRGLQFEYWKPGTEAMKDFYAELPISIGLTGSYHDFGDFVSDIAKLPRIVTLQDINISQNKDGGLKMDLTAVTYRYLDEEEIAKRAREKAAQDAAKKK